MEFRNSEPQHVTWVKSLKDLFMALTDYVKQHHLTGPSWNAQGMAVKDYKDSPAAGTTTAAQPQAAAPAAGAMLS